jgi:hypothetical protein
VLDSINGTLLPYDVPAIGRAELLSVAQEPSDRGADLPESTAYRSVKRMQAQPWMVGSQDTMVSSATHYLKEKLRKDADAVRSEKMRGNQNAAKPTTVNGNPPAHDH